MRVTEIQDKFHQKKEMVKSARKPFLQPRYWWLWILVIYVVSRLLSVLIFTSLSQQQGYMPSAGFWEGEKTSFSYLESLQFWDTGHYYDIYQQGYPSTLPRDEDGVIGFNVWAFYPLYPFTIRVLSFLIGQDGTHEGWFILSLLVAFLAGLGIAFVLYKVFALVTTHKKSLWAVAFFCFSPVSPILQVAYAESLGVLFLVIALYFVMRSRYFFASPFILCMSLTRPLVVGFGLMLGLIFIARLIATIKNGRFASTSSAFSGEKSVATLKNTSFARKNKSISKKFEVLSSPKIFTSKSFISLCILGIFTVLCSFLWPFIAWQVTGDMSAYAESETAWRGGGSVEVVAPWIDMFKKHFGFLNILIMLLALGVIVWWLFSRTMQKTGIVLQSWAIGYITYLILFLHPQSSTWRILFFPLVTFYLWLALLTSNKYFRYSIIFFFVILQYLWSANMWFVIPDEVHAP